MPRSLLVAGTCLSAVLLAACGESSADSGGPAADGTVQRELETERRAPATPLPTGDYTAEEPSFPDLSEFDDRSDLYSD